MAQMFPNYLDPEKTIPDSPGKKGEVAIYKLLRDQTPNTWKVRYDLTLFERPNDPRTEHQIDFLIMVPGKGFFNLDAKGHGYNVVDGVFYFEDRVNGKVRCDNLAAKPSSAIHALNRINQQLTGVNFWGAFGYALAFPFTRNLQTPGNIPVIQLDDDEKLSIQRTIENILNQHPNTVFSQYQDQLWNYWLGVSMGTQDLALEIQANEGILSQHIELTYGMLQDAIMQREYSIISGSAGTGKTVFAKKLAIFGSGCRKKVLYVCFNSLLGFSVKNDLAGFPNVEAWTFCRLGNSSVLNNKKLNKQTMEECISSFTLAVQALNQEAKYDMILVDEAQDFSEAALGILRCMLKSSGAQMILFADVQQTIFTHEWRTPAWFTNAYRTTLSHNLRNTKMIHSYFKNISQENTKCFGATGCEVVFRHFNEQLENVIEQRLDEGYKPQHIAVLSFIDDAVKNIPAIKGHPVNRSDYNNWLKGECIWASTLHAFKGLEADCVILIVSSEGINQEDWKKNLYVGSSRAKVALHLLPMDQASENWCRSWAKNGNE